MRKFSIFIFALILSGNLLARESTLLDSGWRFKSGEVTNAEQPGFNDGDWQAVSIPHNWGWEEAQQGKDFYRGPGWYRRDLNIGAPQSGKRYFLRFEAASLVADVYLNGERLGQHRGAFGAFAFEITTNLSATGTNLLAVRVSNQWEPDIAPLSGDFSVYGGIYRPVHLIVTGGENFMVTDHGSPGVAWLQTSVTKKQAVIDVTAQISNGTLRKQSLTLVASVFDASGKLVIKGEESLQLSPNVTAPYSLQVVVPNPHLWNGRLDPYLYQAVVELRSADGVVDSVAQPLGLRFYSVDPDKGFFLNGRPYHLHGVNRHQDRFNQGWAISEADMDEDLQLIKEMGCTVVRCAHYQHSDYFYSLCDRAGILVWAELPQVNEINASAQFAGTSRSQLLDLIRQLAARGLGELCRRIDFVHLRQFRPDENARPVAQAVKIIAVLVVRAADDGAAHFLDELDVLVHVRLGNRPALVEAVLVPVHAVQMIRPAVKEKSLVRVHRIKSQAQRLRDRIHHAVRRTQFHDGLVKIRVQASVPQMRVGHHDLQRIQRGDIGRELEGFFALDHQLSAGIEHAGDQCQGLFSEGAIGYLRGYVNHRLFFRDARLQPGDAGRAVVGDHEIFPAGHNQMHRAINPAIDRKIAAQRRNVRFPLVAHAHGEPVGAGGGQVGGDFKSEGAERAAMLAEPCRLQINIRHHGWPPQTAKNIFCRIGAIRCSSRAGTSRARDKSPFPAAPLPNPNCAEWKPPASRRR